MSPPDRDLRTASGFKKLGFGLEDPAIAEPEYTADELEFMTAVQAYKEHHHRPFPTCREVLCIVLALGYRKVAGPSPDAIGGGMIPSAETQGRDDDAKEDVP